MLDAVKDIAVADNIGNLEPQPSIFPDGMAPVIANMPEGRTLIKMRWGMPTPPKYLEGKNRDPGVTNIRNTSSPHWRRWLKKDSRCLVPFTSFSEPGADKKPVWFAEDDERPLMFFAGVWTNWTSVRKVKDGETTDNLFGFLTTKPNDVVGPVHPKAMPVILTEAEEMRIWLEADASEALGLQRPLPDGQLKIVAQGSRGDGRADPKI